ncbi:MAG: ATP-binding protein, partial [Candidatus Levybacteria bacterium]|nr:ATP-binding protein [Candidatus Levybacteria bacterium]
MDKQSTQKFIDISPHRSILIKIAQTGYSIQEALSELIDNSIDARLPSDKLVVTVDISPDMIVISDTGSGMTEEQAAKSIRLGFSEKKGQLGEFGLGLKTSTSFLGKSFTLITSPHGSDEEYVLEYDEDHWLERGDWYKYPFIINRGVDPNKSGTTVIIKRLKIDFSEKLLRNIQEEFGMRFGPFIKNGELELIFNKEVCPPFVPQIIDDSKNEFTFDFEGGKAWGWWGYQLSGLNKSYYGFHTYRRGRLVTTYDKIGLTPNQDIKQIIGDLHIEGIPITHDKKGWLKSSKQYQELEKIMRDYFKPFERRPKRILSGFPASAGKVMGTVRQV